MGWEKDTTEKKGLTLILVTKESVVCIIEGEYMGAVIPTLWVYV
jgi:hypothetical protein